MSSSQSSPNMSQINLPEGVSIKDRNIFVELSIDSYNMLSNPRNKLIAYLPVFDSVKIKAPLSDTTQTSYINENKSSETLMSIDKYPQTLVLKYRGYDIVHSNDLNKQQLSELQVLAENIKADKSGIDLASRESIWHIFSCLWIHS